ncbi:MAG: hypothetical protein VX589_17255, partial [Myxococcota bacterium]|nr:hypothetical protein [Myxococcota bacterium]
AASGGTDAASGGTDAASGGTDAASGGTDAASGGVESTPGENDGPQGGSSDAPAGAGGVAPQGGRDSGQDDEDEEQSGGGAPGALVCPDIAQYCETKCAGEPTDDGPDGCPIPICPCDLNAACGRDACGPLPEEVMCPNGERPFAQCTPSDGRCTWRVQCPAEFDECIINCDRRFEAQLRRCLEDADCVREAEVIHRRCHAACQEPQCPDLNNYCELACTGEPTPEIPLGCRMPQCRCPQFDCAPDACGDRPDEPQPICPDGGPAEPRCLRSANGRCAWDDLCPDACPPAEELCMLRCDGAPLPEGCEPPDLCRRCAGEGCGAAEFRCLDGRCIDGLGRCDGRRSCADGSDEFDCPPPVECPDLAEICDAMCAGEPGPDVPPTCPIPRCDCDDDDRCRADECGPAPRVIPCPGGGGPNMACVRDDAGMCGWRVDRCPALNCQADEIAFEGRCVRPCLGNNECGSGESCRFDGDICLPPPGCDRPDVACIEVCHGICGPADICSVDGSRLTCRRLAPPCPLGTSAELRDGCYTGRCVTPEECRAERCRPGDTKPADDGCNTCFCGDGGLWACTKRACPDQDVCNRDGQPVICDVLPPQCDGAESLVEVALGCYTGACVTPAQCDRADACEPGDSRVADDGCNRCRCDEAGNWRCSTLRCEQPCLSDDCPDIEFEACPDGSPARGRCERDERGRCGWRVDECEPVECPDVGDYCRAQCDGNISVDLPAGCPMPSCLPCDEQPCEANMCFGRPDVPLCRDGTRPEVACLRQPAGECAWQVGECSDEPCPDPRLHCATLCPDGPRIPIPNTCAEPAECPPCNDARCTVEECGEGPAVQVCGDGAAPTMRCERADDGRCMWSVDACEPICPDLSGYCNDVCQGRAGIEVPEGCPVPGCDCGPDGCTPDRCGAPPPLPQCDDGARPRIACRADDAGECGWQVDGCPPSEDECEIRCQRRSDGDRAACAGDRDCDRLTAETLDRCLLACEVTECPDVSNYCALVCNGEQTPDIPLGCPIPACRCPEVGCFDAECGMAPRPEPCPDGQARDIRCERGEDGQCGWHAKDCEPGCPQDGFLCGAVCDGRDLPPDCAAPEFCPRCPDDRCAPGEFQCEDGACVTGEGVCDGRVTCRDGSDEVDCPDDVVCPSALAICTTVCAGEQSPDIPDECPKPECDCDGECRIDECPPAPRVALCPNGEPRSMVCERADGRCAWTVDVCPALACDDGEVELDGVCVRVCAGDNECLNGQVCNAGDAVCLRPPGCDEAPNIPCVALCYGYCVPAEECSVDGSEIDCRRLPPECPPGSLAEIRDRCYTGRCLTPDECRGEQCRPGDTRPAEDGCNECVCMDGGAWACTKRACPGGDVCNRDGRPLICDGLPPACEPNTVPEIAFGCFTGACLSPEDCVPDDRCLVGEVRPADDGCNTCECNDEGRWLCTALVCDRPCDDIECGLIGLPACPNGQPPLAECIRQPNGVCGWQVERCEDPVCPEPADLCRAECSGENIDVPPGCPRPRCLPCDEDECGADACGAVPAVDLCADGLPEIACRRGPSGDCDWMVSACDELVCPEPDLHCAALCPGGPRISIPDSCSAPFVCGDCPAEPCGLDECGQTPDRVCPGGSRERLSCERNDAGVCTWIGSGCEPAACGGLLGAGCSEGQVCVDNPSDNCDPQNGGADCPGQCVEVNDGCRDNAECPPGQRCDNGRCAGNGLCICPTVAMPVCGENNQTYGNGCLARCAGVAYTDGACGLGSIQ